MSVKADLPTSLVHLILLICIVFIDINANVLGCQEMSKTKSASKSVLIYAKVNTFFNNTKHQKLPFSYN